MPNFGEVLRRLRRAKRLSQDELGAAANLNGQTISNIETGKVQVPRGDTYRNLAGALGMSIADLDKASGADTVTIELPRAAYESIADRASSEGTLDVTAFIIRLCVKKKMVFDDFDNPPSQKRFNSQTPPPAPAGKPAAATPAPAKRPSAPTPD